MHHFFIGAARVLCLVCRPDLGAGGGWHPALDSGLDQSMAAESTLIYPKARPQAAPASLRQSSASLRPEGDHKHLYVCLPVLNLSSSMWMGCIHIANTPCSPHQALHHSQQQLAHAPD